MSTIYRKTDKGRAEIETRVHRLPPRLRTALIMVDGQRDEAALATLIQQCDEVLDALLAQGFIAALAPAPATKAAAVKAAPPAVAARDSGFAPRQREAVRMLADAVGPLSEALAIQIEKAKDEMTLRPLLVLARDSIRNVRGSAAAAAFESKFLS